MNFTRGAKYRDQRPVPQPMSSATVPACAISGDSKSKISSPARRVSSSVNEAKRAHSSPNDDTVPLSALRSSPTNEATSVPSK